MTNWDWEKQKEHLASIASQGGLASAAKLTEKQRVKRAKKATRARWQKYREQKSREEISRE